MTTLVAPRRVQMDAAARPASRVSSYALLRVEARKLLDTRAGFWLLIANAVLIVAAAGVVAFVVPALARVDGVETTGVLPATAFLLMQVTINSLTVLLPVLAILLATGEWTQRGALVTFVLEPRRWRIMLAKITVVVAAAAVFCLVAAGVAAATWALASGVQGGAGAWTFDARTTAWNVVGTLAAALMGFALGAALMNSAAAIVAYFLVPVALQALTFVGPKVAEVVTWIDLSGTLSVAMQTGQVNWVKLATSAAVWLVLPLTIGLVRWTKRDIA